jgi:hypothetical protein
LQEEVKALDFLAQQLFLELHDGNLVRKRATELTTWRGRYFDALGHVLSVYCVYKLLATTVNVVLQRVGRKDPVTLAAEIAVTWLGMDIDVQFWSHHVSFALVGILAAASIRGLLIQLTKVQFRDVLLNFFGSFQELNFYAAFPLFCEQPVIQHHRRVLFASDG